MFFPDCSRGKDLILHNRWRLCLFPVETEYFSSADNDIQHHTTKGSDKKLSNACNACGYAKISNSNSRVWQIAISLFARRIIVTQQDLLVLMLLQTIIYTRILGDTQFIARCSHCFVACIQVLVGDSNPRPRQAKPGTNQADVGRLSAPTWILRLIERCLLPLSARFGSDLLL